jgi:hypothetical protein
MRLRGAARLTLMRLSSIVCALFLLCACAKAPRVPTVYDQCGAKPSQGWKLLYDAPADADALMDISSGQQSIRAQLGIKATNRSEAWFRGKNGNLRYCRYVPNVDTCVQTQASAEFVDFSRFADHWSAAQPMVSVCVIAR